MSDDSPSAVPYSGREPDGGSPPSALQQGERVLPKALVKRGNGVFFDASMQAPAFLAAVNHVFGSDAYFAGIDYPVFIKALYNIGPALPGAAEPLIRFAADINPFDPQRRGLYKPVKIDRGAAEYLFESLFIEETAGPDGSGTPAIQVKLDFDEFVAAMWSKGVRFGIDVPALKAVIASGKVERIVVARRLEATPGQDAQIVEVSQEIHRSDAPREMANGRMDLLSFKNRFPQIKKGMRLLKKVPRTAGLDGYELSGTVLQPALPADVDLGAMAGPGTLIERQVDGEFLVSSQEGLMSIDGQGQISIGTKIVSRDGVSSRTTGNLRLTAEYEEFGEVQEQRLIDGCGITIHGDVFGNIHSRGGDIVLNSNLVGGSAFNVDGNIRVKGVASGSVLQTKAGEVVVERAESCIISGTRVVVKHASNCEIIADEVIVTLAEGCAVAGRNIEIDSAGPRKQSEMLVFPLVPDRTGFNQQIAEFEAKAEAFAQAALKCRDEIDRITHQPDLSHYLTLANKIRKNALVLTPDQLPQYQQLTAAIAPALKTLGKLSLDARGLEAQQAHMLEQAQQVILQRKEAGGESRCRVRMVTGETVVRSMTFQLDSGRVYDSAPKDIKARLRGATSGLDPIFAGSSGSLDWTFDAG